MEALLNTALGTVFWSTISFLVVLVLMRRLAWGPILQGLKDREEEIDGALNKAKEARAEIENLKRTMSACCRRPVPSGTACSVMRGTWRTSSWPTPSSKPRTRASA